MTLFQTIRFYCGYLLAIRNVKAGREQRIAAPGKWRVWREGETVKHERINPP